MSGFCSRQLLPGKVECKNLTISCGVAKLKASQCCIWYRDILKFNSRWSNPSYISYPSLYADARHVPPLCRCFRRHSRAALNRQQEMMSHCPALPQLRLLDYLQRRKERKPAPSIDLKISKAGNVSQWHNLQTCSDFGEKVNVVKYVKRTLLFNSLVSARYVFEINYFYSTMML